MQTPISRIRKGLKLLGRKVYIDLVVDLAVDDCLDEFDEVPRDLPPDERRCFLINLLEHPKQPENSRSMETLIAVNARRIEATDYLHRSRDDLTREFAEIGFDNNRGITPLMLYLYRISTDPNHPDLDYLRKQYLFMCLHDSGPRSSTETPHRQGRFPQREQ